MATIYGDMEGTLASKAKAQTLFGVTGELNYLYGDAYLIENKTGGNDVLTGGLNSFANFLYGDAREISHGKGGNDALTGGVHSFANNLYGDAHQMSESEGGNDVLAGGFNSGSNTLYGDAYQMSFSKGGNDALTGGDDSFTNFLYGDSYQMSGSQGGNDALSGGDNTFANILYGDAYRMSNSKGGNDVLMTGSNNRFNELFGDATELNDSEGGNDILIARDKSIFDEFVTQNNLYGDAIYYRYGNVVCGNDRLISGTGNENMYGDIDYFYNEQGISDIDLTRVTTGHDVFVFSANNGSDTIHDFRHGEDKIELNGVGVTSFDALMAQDHIHEENGNVIISFGSNTITVLGVPDLTAADFLFT